MKSFYGAGGNAKGGHDPSGCHGTCMHDDSQCGTCASCLGSVASGCGDDDDCLTEAETACYFDNSTFTSCARTCRDCHCGCYPEDEDCPLAPPASAAALVGADNNDGK